jgi:hypothetical protein
MYGKWCLLWVVCQVVYQVRAEVSPWPARIHTSKSSNSQLVAVGWCQLWLVRMFQSYRKGHKLYL